MRRRLALRRLDAVVALCVVVPFVALVLQALGDSWHGRTLLPQQIGTRGLRTVLDDPILIEAVIGSFAVAAVALAWPAARHLAASRSFAGDRSHTRGSQSGTYGDPHRQR